MVGLTLDRKSPKVLSTWGTSVWVRVRDVGLILTTVASVRSPLRGFGRASMTCGMLMKMMLGFVGVVRLVGGDVLLISVSGDYRFRQAAVSFLVSVLFETRSGSSCFTWEGCGVVLSARSTLATRPLVPRVEGQ